MKEEPDPEGSDGSSIRWERPRPTHHQTTFRAALHLPLALALGLCASSPAQEAQQLQRFSEADTLAALAELRSELVAAAEHLNLRHLDTGYAQAETYDPKLFLPPAGKEAEYPAVLLGGYDNAVYHQGLVERQVEFSMRRLRSDGIAKTSFQIVHQQNRSDRSELVANFSGFPSIFGRIGDERAVYVEKPDGSVNFGTRAYISRPGCRLTWRWGPWVVDIALFHFLSEQLTEQETTAFNQGKKIDLKRFRALETEAQERVLRSLGEFANAFNGVTRRVEAFLGLEPTLTLDREEVTRGSLIKITGRGFEFGKAVKIYIDGADHFAALQTERGGAFEGWIWVPDTVPFGTREVWAETVGGTDRSNKVKLEVEPVTMAQLWKRFDAVVARFMSEIPRNDRWSGALRSGSFNNIGYAVGSAGAGMIYAASTVLTLGHYPQSVFPDGRFICSSYQADVLSLLDKIRWNEDAEVRALLDGLDHGPFTSGLVNLYYLSHYFVVVWPHGPALGEAVRGIAGGNPTWQNTGIGFDPWPLQKPWLWELKSGNAEWARASVYAKHWKDYWRIYLFPVPENFGNYKDKYPVTGAAFYVSPGQAPRVVPEFAIGNEAPQSISVHSPVRLELRSTDGSFAGRTSTGQESSAIPGVDVFTLKKPQDGEAWFATLPEGEFELKVIATGDGIFQLRSKQAGKKIHEYEPVSIRSGDVATLVLNSALPPQRLTRADGTQLSPNAIDRPSVATPPPNQDGSTSPVGDSAAAGGALDPGAGDDPAVPRPQADAGRPQADGGRPQADGGTPRHLTASLAGTDRTRTLVYEQITTFTTDITGIHIGPILSDDGRKILLATESGGKRAYVLNADGSDMQEVDMVIATYYDVGFSGDGSRIVSSDGHRIQATTVGSKGRDVFRDIYGKINGLRLSGNGEQVAFTLTTGEQAGIHTVGFNGRGRKHVVTATAVGEALGIPADHLRTFKSNGSSLAVSRDGSRIVFACHTGAYGLAPAGAYLFTVHSDGSNLRRVAGPLEWIQTVGISADGRVVVYVGNKTGEQSFGSAVRFGGEGELVIADHTDLGYPGLGVGSEQVYVSHDGSVAVMGRLPYAIATDGGGKTQLGTHGGDQSRFHDRLPKFSASGDMRKFVFEMIDLAGHVQLGMLSVDPADQSAVPHLSEITMSPVELGLGTGEWLDLSASCRAPPQTLPMSKTCTFYHDGVYVKAVGEHAMRDDGNSQDLAADDGQWGATKLIFSKSCPVGSYSARIKAEVRDARNRLRATAIEFAGPDLLLP